LGVAGFEVVGNGRGPGAKPEADGFGAEFGPGDAEGFGRRVDGSVFGEGLGDGLVVEDDVGAGADAHAEAAEPEVHAGSGHLGGRRQLDDGFDSLVTADKADVGKAYWG